MNFEIQYTSELLIFVNIKSVHLEGFFKYFSFISCKTKQKEQILEMNVVDLTWEQLKPQLNSLLYDQCDKSLSLQILNKLIEVQVPENHRILLISLLKSYTHSSTTSKHFKDKIIELFNLIIPQDLTAYIAIFIAYFNHEFDIKKPNLSVDVKDLRQILLWVNHFVENYELEDDLKLLNFQLEVASQILAHKKSKGLQLFKNLTSQFISKKSDSYLQLYNSKTLSIPSQLLLIASLSYCKKLPETEFPKVITYFANDVLLSKDKFMLNQLYTLRYFNTYFIGQNLLSNRDLVSELLPELEKSILRSNDYVVNNILIDFSENFKLCKQNLNMFIVTASNAFTKFFNLLLSNLKTTSNEMIRVNSFTVLKNLLSNCVDLPNEIGNKIVDELAKNWKMTSNIDFKVKYISLIRSMQASFDRSIQVLKPFATKDQNEILLNEFISSFVCSVSRLQSIPDDVAKIIIAGLNDKKLLNRKQWFIALAEFLSSSELFEDESVLTSLQSNIKEFMEAPFKFPVNIIHIIIFLIKFKNLQIPVSDEILQTLLNPKFYLKIGTAQEQKWFIEAVFAIEPIGSVEFGHTVIYTIISKNIDNELSHQALLKLNYATSEVMTGCICDALYNLLIELDDMEIKEKFNYSYKFLKSIVYAITCGTAEANISSEEKQKPYTERILLELIIICHYQKNRMFKFKNGWVDLVQKTECNPASIITKFGTQFLKKILVERYPKAFNSSKAVADAIIDSVSTMAFISPDFMGPIINDMVAADSDTSKLMKFSDLQDAVNIWKCSEDELVHDPTLSQKSKNIVDNKNSKDYATRKWEAELKKELASKQSSSQKVKAIDRLNNKKTPKEEQELLREQFTKEANIRNQVADIIVLLNRSIGLVDSLCDSLRFKYDNGYKYWFNTSILSLLNLIKHFTKNSQTYDASKSLIDDKAVNALLKASNILTLNESNLSSLNAIKNLIGVAISKLITPKSLNISLLPKYDMLATDELISNIYFKLKYNTDKKPLSSFGLIYILPLLIENMKQKGEILKKKYKNTMQTTKKEFVEEDIDEEQLLLTIEILSNHGDTFQDTAVPRGEIMTTLLLMIELIPSKNKLFKDCFNLICANVSDNLSSNDMKSILIGNLTSPNKFIRTLILEQLDEEFILGEEGNFELSMNDYIRIWICCFDQEDTGKNMELANSIWTEDNLSLTESLIAELIPFLDNEDFILRLSVAKAISEAIKLDQKLFTNAFNSLINLFIRKLIPPEPIYDEFGLVIKSSEQQKDQNEVRSGISLTLKQLAPFFDVKSVIEFFNMLLIEEPKLLSEPNKQVFHELQEASIEVIKVKGLETMQQLISIFDESLNINHSIKQLKQSTVILYGVLVTHLDKNDKKLLNAVDQLIKTLITSTSEEVDYTISRYLAPLVPKFSDNLQTYLDELFIVLFEGSSRPQRRAAAYGIAGLIKGYGIKGLNEFDIIRNLIDASEDSKSPVRRESASFAIECLDRSLGKLFEPYVLEVVPLILQNLGDHVTEVRTAADYASKIIMKNTTPFGVKKLIPLAIDNLDEIAWRSKKGSVELLGTMAYLDPTQLSASLSTIVPEIVGVLNDSHKEVRKAADQALKRFGEVIRNPEIQKSVPILIKAIGDPTKFTEEALDALIKTQFVHYIDGPSLALIIHVIHRGMLDRSATTKRKSCQIVGNMSILVDSKDLIPYLNNLISELEIAMVDPVPSTRATAARALGSLVEKLGEEQFPDLIDKLMNTLSDPGKEGDRMGSAQALAEVISGLGLSKLEELLPTILLGASSGDKYCKSGYIPLLLYLPLCFGSMFAPYISKILPPILSGLADDDDQINDISIKAGKLIVSNYANKAVDLLLPELEAGLSDSNHKIRLSSIKLTGDLLFKIAGISQKIIDIEMDDGEEKQIQETIDIFENNAANTALLEILGQERRDRVLSLLFICRSDISGMVRNAAIEIWNPIVANTPKTIKEILPVLANIIIRRLASPDESQRRINAAALGDLVRRVGPEVLKQLLPTSEEVMFSGDADAKQGICIALTEIMSSTVENNIIAHQETFIKIVGEAIIDSNENVRESAAQAFDVLLEAVGKPAIDGIIPHLLTLLDNESESENAIKALREIMANKAEDIFPILISSLLAPPLDASKSLALGSLSEVAGHTLFGYLTDIINTFIDSLISYSSNNAELFAVISKSFDKLLLSINDNEGLHPLMQQLLSLLKSENKLKVKLVYNHLSTFFSSTTLDYSVYKVDIVSNAISRLGDSDEALVKAAWSCLNELVKHQSKESLEKLVVPAEQSLRFAGTANEDLPGFSIVPKGPNCVLPIFIHGLMYGSSSQKEISASAIAYIVSKTPPMGLKPFFTVITGPLIRVIGERVNSDVKAAILSALNQLLEKIPQFLRPFIPQLQRTFIKSLADSSNEILRLRAAKALGTLIKYQPRIDPLVNELINGVKNSSQDVGVNTAMLKALNEVFINAGNKLNESSKNSVLSLIEEEIFVVTESGDNKLIIAYAKLIGSISKNLQVDEAFGIIKDKILVANGDKFGILTLNAFLKESSENVMKSGLIQSVVKYLINNINSTDAYLSEESVKAVGKLLLNLGEPDIKSIGPELIENLVEELSKVTVKPPSTSNDARRLALIVFRTVARKKYDEIIKPNIDVIGPCVFSCVRDPIIPIKLSAEKCYLDIFKLVEDSEMVIFNEWFSHLSKDTKSITNCAGLTTPLRSISDYTKRVGVRLAKNERERIEAGGDAETVFSDRIEDENEIQSVGGMELTSV